MFCFVFNRDNYSCPNKILHQKKIRANFDFLPTVCHFTTTSKSESKSKPLPFIHALKKQNTRGHHGKFTVEQVILSSHSSFQITSFNSGIFK